MSGPSATVPTGERELTLEEWGDMPEDEEGELVDGRLEEAEMADPVHEAVVAWLSAVLRAWLRPRGGWVFGSEVKLAVAVRRGRKADLLAWLPGRLPHAARGLVRDPPDVAVEVVSPRPRDARRDRLDKAADYAAFGVRSYWIVDPQRRAVEMLELAPDGRYVRALGAGEGTVSPVPGCEGLALDLDALWAEVDELLAPVPDAGG